MTFFGYTISDWAEVISIVVMGVITQAKYDEIMGDSNESI